MSSGDVEPDTIIIRRDWHDRVEFGSAMRGDKSHVVIMKENQSENNEECNKSNGIETRPLTEEESRRQACLSQDEALQLAELGVVLESLYGAPRDVEWAICDKVLIIVFCMLYLLFRILKKQEHIYS